MISENRTNPKVKDWKIPFFWEIEKFMEMV